MISNTLNSLNILILRSRIEGYPTLKMVWKFLNYTHKFLFYKGYHSSKTFKWHLIGENNRVNDCF